ncbi:MAG TPA: serine hydrolase [Victivallales bacterium]|nr:serine hydrolase [Victivallales bacterium]
MIKVIITLLGILVFTQAVYASQNLPKVNQVALQFAKEFSNNPTQIDNLFSKNFIKRNTNSKNWLINTYKENGQVTKVEPVKIYSNRTGKFNFFFSNQTYLPITIVLLNNYKIQNTEVGYKTNLNDSFLKIVNDLKKWPGKNSLTIKYISENNKNVVNYNSNKIFPIASSFKLYVLGALYHAIHNKQLKWNDIIHINHKYNTLTPELPQEGGTIEYWPNHAPVTLQTLATLMIQKSDNTAADTLIHIVGRKNIEAILKNMGDNNSELMVPFCTIKQYNLMIHKPSIGREYLKAKTVSKKLEILEELTKQKTPNWHDYANFDLASEGLAYRASTSDLCNAMIWFGKSTHFNTNSTVLQILASFGPKFGGFKYVGLKGGSFGTNTLNTFTMTYLIENKNDKWFTVSISCQDANEPINIQNVNLLMNRVFILLNK